MVNMDQELMQAKGVSPADILNAVNQQNLVIPSGTAKIGGLEYDVRANAAAQSVQDLGAIPVKQVGATTIYVRDVATVSDGFQVQSNVVRQDGRRGVLVSVIKSGSASTLNVVAGIQRVLPRIAAIVPPELKIRALADQSIFVRSAIGGVVREAVIATVLDWLDDPAFSGQLAKRSDHRHLHSVVHPEFNHHSWDDPPDDQHHDPRRVGAGRRYSGGRRHGGDREHPSQSRHGQRSKAGDSGWFGTGRHTRPGRDTVHLHRISTHVHAQRRRALSFRAAGGSRGLRDARLAAAV